MTMKEKMLTKAREMVIEIIYINDYHDIINLKYADLKGLDDIVENNNYL